MSLTVVPIVSADLPSLPPIQFAAYAASSSIHPFLHPNGTTPQALSAVLHSYTAAFSDPSVALLKVVDTSAQNPAAPIALAKWHFYPTPRAPTSSSAPEDPGPEDTTSNAALAALFFGGMNAASDKVIAGRAHARLGTVVVLPEQQGRGAGSMLVRWGCEKADAMGLECFLEASPAGKALYERAGFRAVEEFVVDLGEWGGSGLHTTWIMSRGKGEVRDDRKEGK